MRKYIYISYIVWNLLYLGGWRVVNIEDREVYIHRQCGHRIQHGLITVSFTPQVIFRFGGCKMVSQIFTAPEINVLNISYTF